jgi:hypothetical protein
MSAQATIAVCVLLTLGVFALETYNVRRLQRLVTQQTVVDSDAE